MDRKIVLRFLVVYEKKDTLDEARFLIALKRGYLTGTITASSDRCIRKYWCHGGTAHHRLSIY